jgi:hypothetical protein
LAGLTLWHVKGGVSAFRFKKSTDQVEMRSAGVKFLKYMAPLMLLGISASEMNAQASLEIGGGAYSWFINASDDDGTPDKLSRTPGPGWALSLIYRHRPKNKYVGLMLGLIHERREFDVDFADGGLGGGLYGSEYVRMNTTYLIAGLNVRLGESGGHWLRPTFAACVANQNVASGYFKQWSFFSGYDYETQFYSDEKGAEYAAPLFLGVGWGVTFRFSDQWFIDLEPNVGFSHSLRRPNEDVPFGHVQYQGGIRVSFGVSVPKLFGPRIGEALRKDRELRNGTRAPDQ